MKEEKRQGLRGRQRFGLLILSGSNMVPHSWWMVT